MSAPGWKRTHLGHELQLLYGKSLPASARMAGDIRVFGSNGTVGFHNKALVPGPGIIVGRKGSVGEIAFSEKPFWPIDTTYYVSNRGENNWRFLYFLLQHLQLTGLNSHSTVPGLNRESVYSIESAFPPKSEQEKIAAVLWKIQKAVEIEDAIARNARDLKKSLLRGLFTLGLHGSDSMELDSRKVPAYWRPCRFTDFATLHRGYDLPVQDRLDGTVPIVGSNGIVGYHSVAKLKGPGVATGRSGTMGLSFYIESDYWPLNTALYVSDFHSNNPLFVHYFFQYFDFERYSAGVSVPTLNRNLVHEAMIAIPDEDEQLEIADILRTVDRKIAAHESKKRALQDLFRTMLHKLMTAQIRVNDLNIDTSEVDG